MERVFQALEETMNKSSIIQFRNFLKKYSDVTKWFMCSDYCLDDKSKANNVVSFVIYPYILDFKEWNSVIESMQKTDLKHCRQVSSSFCNFAKMGFFFSFNFILDENCILEKWKDKFTLDRAIDDFIAMTKKWQETTPENAGDYRRINKKLHDLRNQTRGKKFSYKLLGRIMEVSFLASYLKYLLYREAKDIETFCWLSDRDAITSWNNGIYFDLYHMVSHCIISEKLTPEKDNLVEELMINDINENMFYDPLNRVADFICGGIADFNFVNGMVSGNKQKTIMEEVVTDNDYLIILKIDKGVARASQKFE